jgi:hypothetical protein
MTVPGPAGQDWPPMNRPRSVPAFSWWINAGRTCVRSGTLCRWSLERPGRIIFSAARRLPLRTEIQPKAPPGGLHQRVRPRLGASGSCKPSSRDGRSCGQPSDGTPCRTSGASTLPMRRGAPPSRESHPLGPNHRRDRRSGRASRPGAADAGQGGAQPEVPRRGGDTHVLKWPDIPCSLTLRFSGGWHSGPFAATDC